jgi:hypothetical protein
MEKQGGDQLTETWQAVVSALEQETKKMELNPPDEVKRFHYGLITHSEAGKYSYNQYLGHFVHFYGWQFVYSSNILAGVLAMTQDPLYDLKHSVDAFRKLSPKNAEQLEFSGQKTQGKFLMRVLAVLDSLETKDDLLKLMTAWRSYCNRLYWWIHWYFPWGAGPAICPRVSKEDVLEMVRLLETA